jgi:hypothetical protein
MPFITCANARLAKAMSYTADADLHNTAYGL